MTRFEAKLFLECCNFSHKRYIYVCKSLVSKVHIVVVSAAVLSCNLSNFLSNNFLFYNKNSPCLAGVDLQIILPSCTSFLHFSQVTFKMWSVCLSDSFVVTHLYSDIASHRALCSYKCVCVYTHVCVYLYMCPRFVQLQGQTDLACHWRHPHHG